MHPRFLKKSLYSQYYCTKKKLENQVRRCLFDISLIIIFNDSYIHHENANKEFVEAHTKG